MTGRSGAGLLALHTHARARQHTCRNKYATVTVLTFDHNRIHHIHRSQVTGRSGAGLLAAALTAVVPSYISRSVGGSYDNEGVAIFALLFVFYLWIKSVATGSMLWSAATALAYFYMVAAWGGYVFIINIIPIYVLAMMVAGRFSSRLYVAYSTFYALGSLLAMQVSAVVSSCSAL